MRKNLFLLLVFFAGTAAFAENQNLCSDWEKNGSACIIGAGHEGYGWIRDCESDPLICKRHGRNPDPTVCKATTICVGRQVNPNQLEGPCTDWQKGDSSYSCENARESRWVRSCTWHNLETNMCSVDQPE